MYLLSIRLVCCYMKHIMVDLHDLDDDDELSYYYVSFWLKTCHIILELLRKTLNLDDVVSKDKTIQTNESHAFDKTDRPLVITNIDRLIYWENIYIVLFSLVMKFFFITFVKLFWPIIRLILILSYILWIFIFIFG